MEALGRVREMGFTTCQLSNPPEAYLYGPASERARRVDEVKEAIAATGVTITSVFIMFKGHVWDLVDGPRTIGLVPPETRAERMVHACRVADWAQAVGLSAVASHMGFIPEDPADPVYPGFINATRALVHYSADRGLGFIFETGQETPATLRRTIEDLGLPTVGINLDPANLILYGKGRPLEAVEVLGEWIRNTHCKDGTWPAPGGKLGKETPMGEGEVDFQKLIPALWALGYRGPLTIEREINGEKQRADILQAKQMLEQIRARLISGSP